MGIPEDRLKYPSPLAPVDPPRISLLAPPLPPYNAIAGAISDSESISAARASDVTKSSGNSQLLLSSSSLSHPPPAAISFHDAWEALLAGGPAVSFALFGSESF